MIQLQNISKTFRTPGKSLQVLKDLSLRVELGDMIAIMGRSGAGKSTLLHILAGFIKPDAGSYALENIQVDGYDEEEWAQLRHKKIGYVLQNNGLLFDRNVLKNIMLPLNFTKLSQEQKTQRSRMLAAMLDIEDKLAMNPAKLSGGEQQRTAVARSLVMDAPLLLADEPTGSLDRDTEQKILQLLKSLNEEGKTIIVVTHDREVAHWCKHVYYLEDGRLILE